MGSESCTKGARAEMAANYFSLSPTSDYIILPQSSLETVAGKAYWGARMMATGWAKGG